MKPIDITQYQFQQEAKFTYHSLKGGMFANASYLIIYLTFGLWWALLGNIIGALSYYYLYRFTQDDQIARCQLSILILYIIQLSVFSLFILPPEAGIHFFFLVLPCLLIFFRQVASFPFYRTITWASIAMFFIVELLRDDLSPLEVLSEFQCRFIYLSVILCSVLNLTLYFASFSHSLKMQNSELENLAMTDPLTTIFNRRYIMSHFEQWFEQWQADNDQAVSVLIIDADHFKQINDQFGHDVGDEVLVEIAKTISQSIRSSDLTGRIGGEEFCVLLKDVGSQDAKVLAERIRTRIERLTFLSHPDVKISVSIGLTTLKPSHHSYKDAYHEADNALYQAKHGGRNRCEIAH